jgi:hypothetical protein
MTDESGGGKGAKRVEPTIARRRQDAIGRGLRQLYDGVVNEPVPEEFLSFLEQADERREEAEPPDKAREASGGR